MRISDWSSDVCSSDLPPHMPCPITTISSTFRNCTANSSAAETPWRPGVVSKGGTSAATLRTTKISPGWVSQISAGSDRLSEQAIIMTLGDWPTANSCHRVRSEENKAELQSLMRISYADFCLKKKKTTM